MSNLLEQASLVMIPSGYKEDVVYSEIPLDGSGDLQLTRASNGTRVNSAGLVEVCPWNLFGNSEDGTSGKWGNEYNIASVTLNSTTAPNGTNTGNLIVENSVNGTHWFEQSFSAISGTPYTISVYLKAKERTQCVFYGFADNGVFVSQIVIFNLSTGAVVSQSGTQTNSIENVGNGWYRCSMTLTAGASATGYFAYGLANGGNNSYQGNGTSGLYMWGRQLNTGTLKPYFPTTDRLNVPRLTYQNGGGGCPSLLLEKQSTNVLVYSEQLDNGAWTKDGGTISANATTSPDGTQNADAFIESTANGNHRIYQNSVLGTANQPMTFTVFAKYYGRQYVYLRLDNAGIFTAVFDIQNGTAGAVTSGATSKIENYGNGWYRLHLTLTSPSGSPVTEGLVGLLSGNSFSNASYAGDGTSGAYFWGFQTESASSYATSYIPTTSSSATRVADACFKTGISSLIGQTEGTVFVDLNFNGEIFGLTNNYYIYIGNGLNTNAIYIDQYNNSFRWVVFDGTTLRFYTDVAMTTGRHKLALAYKNNDYSAYLDGTLITTQTLVSGAVPTCSQFSLIGNVSNFDNNVKQINQAALFKTRLTNAELASLTTI